MNDKIRVLLADDHAVVRKGIRQCLEEAGDIEVIAEADNGAEAMQLIEQHQPDIAMLDIRMPDLDGFETCAALRALPGCTALPVIFLTADAQAANRRRARDMDARFFLQKPCESVVFLNAVRTVLMEHED